MIKKIFLFLLLISFFPVYSDDNFPKIESITYDGYLDESSIINIRGVNLITCDSVKIGSKDVNYINKTETLITYNYGDLGYNKGVLNLECNGKFADKYFYFPLIDGIEAKLTGGKLKFNIKGANFKNGLKIYSGNGETIPYDNLFENSIIGFIPEFIKGNSFYVLYDGIKSNLYNSDILIPNITHIVSDKGFNIGDEIILLGSNFSDRYNDYIMVGDLRVTDFSIIDTNTIKFNLPNISGKHDIYISSNGIGSNKININIIGKNIVIEKAYVQGVKIEGISTTYIDKLFITSDDFETKNSLYKVFLNDQQLTISGTEKGKLIISNYVLQPLNNYIFVEYNGIKSNIIDLYNKVGLPYISSVTQDKVLENLRTFKLGLGNFNKETDGIYFNGGLIKPSSCYSGTCKVKISSSTLKGVFTVGRGLTFNVLEAPFDISEGKELIVYNITFDGESKAGTKFEINGENLDDSIISLVNLAEKDSKGYNLSIDNNRITGRLMNGFNSTNISTLNISKYGKTVNLSFRTSELDGNKVEGYGIITDISNYNGDSTVKAGDIITITGKGFHGTDKLLIGTKEYGLNNKTTKLSYFKIPDDITFGNHTLRLKLLSGFQSDSFTLTIFDSNTGSNILLEKKDIEKKVFYRGDDQKDEIIYGISIFNPSDNLKINELKFKIDNFKNNDIGLFSLMISGKKYGKGLIDNNGYLIFKDFLIDKSLIKQNISVVKSSPFIKTGIYTISFEGVIGFKRGTNIKIDSFDPSNLTPSKFGSFEKDLVKCFDSTTDNLYCSGNFNEDDSADKKNSLTDDNIKEETNKSEEINKEILVINNKDKEIEDKKQIIYGKIDGLASKFITNSSKYGLKNQINLLKNLKFKISGIIKRNSNSKNIFFIEYYYDLIDVEYKKAFKNYINSKK